MLMVMVEGLHRIFWVCFSFASKIESHLWRDKKAIHWDFDKITVELITSRLLKLWRKGGSVPQNWEAWLHQQLVWSLLNSFAFEHIYRETNSCVYWLASNTVHYQAGLHEFHVPPTELLLFWGMILRIWAWIVYVNSNHECRNESFSIFPF